MVHVKEYSDLVNDEDKSFFENLPKVDQDVSYLLLGLIIGKQIQSTSEKVVQTD